MFRFFLGTNAPLCLSVESDGLFTSIRTLQNSLYCSTRTDINAICYCLETNANSCMIWIPGNINISAAGTKTNSPLRQSFQLLMYSYCLPLEFSIAQASNSTSLLASVPYSGIGMRTTPAFALCPEYTYTISSYILYVH